MKNLATLLILFYLCPINAQIYRIQEMNTSEIEELDRDSTIVLIPGGILEQHGPYLPSFSDGYMNLALTEEIADFIVSQQGMNALIFPLIPLGTGGANEIGGHYNFPGTYAVRAKTLRAILMDLGSELAEQGFKTVFIIHLHGGPNHNRAIDQAAQYFREVHQGTMVNISNLAFLSGQNNKNEEQKAEDGFTVHAGMDEHSILYHLQPEIVGEDFKKAEPHTGESFQDLIEIAKEENWPGYFGSPRLAEADYGKKAWNSWVKRITNQLKQIFDGTYDFKQPTYFQIISQDPAVKSVIEGGQADDKKEETKQEQWLKKNGLN